MDSKDIRNLQEAYNSVYDDDLREEQEFKSWVTELLDEGYDLSDYTWNEMYDIYNEARESGVNPYKGGPEFGTGLMSSYDNWVGQLISDGYDLSNWTDEGLFEYYEQLCEENGVLGNIIDAGAGAVKKPIENFANRKVGGIAGALGIPGQIAGQKVDQTAQQLKDKDFGGALKTVTGGVRSLMQSYDLYDIILSHLLDEGYADTEDSALVIMANMSEDWRESIVEDIAGNQYTSNPIGNIIKTGAGLVKRVLNGTGPVKRDEPLWDGPETPTKPPVPTGGPKLRDEPLWDGPNKWETPTKPPVPKGGPKLRDEPLF